MALQSCRPTLLKCEHASRAFLLPSLRNYTSNAPSTTATPESFKITHHNSSSSSRSSRSSNSGSVPRWKETPAGMKAPMQMDFAKNPGNKVWVVNNDPARLDEMYEKLLGPGGSRMLPEELKWLAVTHKSFDYGRRGFNDRLAFMGRMTMVMEATKEIVSQTPQEGSILPDEYERRPPQDQQLLSVDNLNIHGPKDVIGKDKLHTLSKKVGLLDVMRWKPRLTRRLESSGVETVINGALMAIIGAITLQHGSIVASKIVRERIFEQLAQDQ